MLGETPMKRCTELLVVIPILATLAGCSRQTPSTVEAKQSLATPMEATPTAVVRELPPALPPEPEPIIIPAGTVVRVRTTNALSTRANRPGDGFMATLAEPLTINGRVIAPRGARVRGVVANSDPGGRVKGRASISVRLVSLEKTAIATNYYYRQAPGTKKRDAMKIGIGSGVGAAIGAIAGGGIGAGIGAAAGAGAGTGYVLTTRGAPAVIPSESVLSFRLQSPVRL